MPNDIPNSTWSETAASNTAPVPNGAPEGWFPSDVNNWGRQCMGATKRFWDHINVTETTGGTTTAYTLTYDVAPQQLWAGELFGFVVNATCGATPTLNVNALGAKSLRRWNGSTWATLGAGDIVANQTLIVYYNSSGSGSYDIVAGFRESTFSGGTLTSTTTMSGAAFNEAARVNVASATTCDIGAAAANYVRITGTTTITGLGTIASGVRRKVVFAGILTLTHNATSLILPTGANITTAAGDCAEFESEGSGNWRCTDYQRAYGGAVGSAPITNSLGADVALNNTSNYFDGPTVAQGTVGTWFVSGTVTVNPVNASSRTLAKLWDGTTVIASGALTYEGPAVPTVQTITLSGFIANPAGNLRISVRNLDSTSAEILYNQSGNGKDSTITAFRIA